MAIIFEDNTDNVLALIDKANDLALQFAGEQIISEIQRLKRPPDVITGFYRASFRVTGQTQTITKPEKDKKYTRSQVISGKGKTYKAGKETIAIDVKSGAVYDAWLEFEDFSKYNGKWKNYGVLMPIRRGALLAIPSIDKIFKKFLTNL